jgi:hypothetical protein|tara:strand:- start:284 stop:418 length:135 start_codon:yes stop_codon:yes gene_type:complete
VISTGKETHHQMQKAYLRGKRNPLPVTSVDTKKWIVEIKKKESK